MGYFSNGSEADWYLEKYCSRCANWRDRNDGKGVGCPIWDLHFLRNYDQFPEHEKTEPAKEKAKEANFFLSFLIPESEKECGNEQCSMFIEKFDRRCDDTLEMFE